ncbi:MAG: T9SS type A sorting domain-containing protein [Chitinophagaceae bacterium]|nr:T9SS type A sorting domain-containing protein [Chitinophagaceae bacterium]
MLMLITMDSVMQATVFFIADCPVPNGYVTDSTDCDDANAAINPAAIEICDGIDNNCDGNIDPLFTFYADSDGDGYGDNNASVTDCAPPSGYVTNNTDCNDANAAIHPGATEICNDIDDNCNAQTDEGLLITFYADNDGDLYGNANNSTLACTLPNGYVTDNTDCDDTNASVYPDAPEILFNGIDDDCDGYLDEFGTGIFSSANTASVFSLFPNPTNGEFEVYLQLNNELNAEGKIEVINLLGQVVYNKTSVLLKGKLQAVINLNDEADGLYLVRVKVDEQLYSGLIVFDKQ